MMNVSPGKLNAEIKAKWLKALRSRKYKQGHGRLRGTDGKFCCLGVLCEIAVKEGIIPAPESDGEDYLYDGDRALTLPDPVADWAFDGRGPCDPEIEGMTLSSWNDGDEFTERKPVGFRKIAELIEANL